MALLSPSRKEIAKLPTPLNKGERLVLAALDTLPEDWRVYVQPSLRMDHPDFVVVHDQYGVCAIEVKGWAREIYRQREDGVIEVWDGHEWQQTHEMPRLQAHRYRRTIVEHFFASPESGNDDWPVVRAAVILPEYTTQEANGLLNKPHLLEAEMHQKVAVWGGDALQHKLLEVLTGYRYPKGMRVSKSKLQRLEWHLAEPEVIAAQRRPLSLSDAAKNLANNPNRARLRRARGPAGCGKSLGLAARAAKLAREGKKVLVLSFNITLPHYLHDLAARHGRELSVRIRNITFTHFHGFCSRVRENAVAVGAENRDVSWDNNEREEDDQLEALISSAIAFYSSGKGERFDAILIDEGQDFKARWWNFLRTLVLNEGGEMLLVADTTQDLYDRGAWTAEPSMKGCGFSGDWTNLPGSYRMPPDLVPIIARFGERFLTDGDFDPPIVPEDHPMRREAAEPTVRHWKNLSSTNKLGAALANEVLVLLAEDYLQPADVVFLCEEHRYGLEAANLLDAANQYVSHVFTSEDNEERRRRKHRFWGGVNGVKGCTVHSFKGWEARGVVLCILPSARSKRLAYVALTRVKGNPIDRAAVVRVLNCDPELNGFQAEFEREFSVAEVPALGGQRRLL